MNSDLAKISARVSKIQGDCTNPASNFYRSEQPLNEEEITRIDVAIAAFVADHLEALNLQTEWDRFKEDLPKLINIDRKIRVITEGTSSSCLEELEELEHSMQEGDPIIGKIQELKSDPTTKRVKDLIASRINPLKNAITNANTAAPQQSDNIPDVTSSESSEGLDEDLEATMEADEEEREEELKDTVDFLSVYKPILAKTIRFFVAQLAEGTYGEKIKEAAKNIDPSVISGAPLLKLLLMADSKRQPILHAYNELELDIPEESQEAILQLKYAMGTVPTERLGSLVERIFYEEESQLSEEEKHLSALLNDAVKNIQIERFDDQVYGKFLHDTLTSYDLYREIGDEANTIEDPFASIKFMAEKITEVGSLYPRAFFEMIGMGFISLNALQAVSPNRNNGELKKQLLICLWEEFNKNPHLSMELSNKSCLWAYLSKSLGETIKLNAKTAIPYTFILPSLIVYQDPRAEVWTREMIEFAKEQKGSFLIPTEVFQALTVRGQMQLAYDVSRYVPLSDRSQCSVQWIHRIKGTEAGKFIPRLLELCLQDAQENIKDMLSVCFPDKEPTAGDQKETKLKLRGLFKYLHSELKEFLRFDSLEQIEAHLLLGCIESSKDDPLKKRELCILLIPELARIGEGKKASQFIIESARDVIIESASGVSDATPWQRLLYSILKAGGLQSGALDEKAFGTLSKLQKDTPLDKVFFVAYFRLIELFPKRSISVQELNFLLQELRDLKNPSYVEFHSQVNEKLSLMLNQGLVELDSIADPLEKLQALYSFAVGFGLIGEFSQLEFLVRRAIPLLKEAEGSQSFSEHLTDSVIGFIKQANNKDSSEISLIESNLIELVFDLIRWKEDPVSYTEPLIELPDLLKDLSYQDGILYREFSKRAVIQALKGIKSIGESAGEDYKWQRLNLLDTLIPIAKRVYQEGVQEIVTYRVQIEFELNIEED